jgi:hypothetical protein
MPMAVAGDGSGGNSESVGSGVVRLPVPGKRRLERANKWMSSIFLAAFCARPQVKRPSLIISYSSHSSKNDAHFRQQVLRQMKN